LKFRVLAKVREFLFLDTHCDAAKKFWAAIPN
jgi:hypothetical protein